MIAGIQRVAHLIGEAGCYFLSILHLAEKITGRILDPIEYYESSIKWGLMQEDCFVIHPARLLSALTGKNWTLTKEAADYQAKPGEQEILRYERTDTQTGKTAVVGHFIAGDGWDPYGKSSTVQMGKLVSKRIFREAV